MKTKETGRKYPLRTERSLVRNGQKSNPVSLLWTGGWDSTFRLLQLLLQEKTYVQPYYIIDPERNSTGTEILFSDKLRQQICSRYSRVSPLLHPTIYINIDTIVPDSEIERAFRNLSEHVPIGNQHEWLPRFCKQHQIYGLEMSTENGSTSGAVWANLPFLKNHFADDPNELSEHDRFLYKNSKTLYKYFHFPLIHYSKQDMLSEAIINGWVPILKKTWFCYQPIYIPMKGYLPCGDCITCNYLKNIEFEWRIPFYSRWIQYTRDLRNRLKRFLSNDTETAKLFNG